MKTYQLVGIGNAVVDVISQTDDTFLDHMGIEKGIMQLVERDRAEVLFGSMDSRTQTPGGSVANTLAGLGNLGLTNAEVAAILAFMETLTDGYALEAPSDQAKP